MNDRMLFIVGSERSGSTLLRLILSSHPEIHIFSDSYDFIIGALCSKRTNINKTENPIVKKEYSEYSEVVKSAASLNEKVQTVLKMARIKEKIEHNKYCGIQMHGNYHIVNKAFPNAKYIHLIRDPRPVCKSAIRYRWHGNYYYAAKKWMKSVREVEEIQKKIPCKNFLLMKYEDMVSMPTDFLANICEFIGVLYTDKMFDYVKYTTYSYPRADDVDSWKKTINKKDIYWVEMVAHAAMKKYGYPCMYSAIKKINFCKEIYMYIDNKTKRLLSNVCYFGPLTYLMVKINRILNKALFRKAEKYYTQKMLDNLK